MRYIIALLMAAVFGMAATQTASAADLPARAPISKAPAMVVSTSWTGCYVAVGGGYGMFNLDHDTIGEAPAVPGAPFGSKLTTGGRGYLATGGIGCDYQFSDRWVVGAFGDGDWSTIKGTHAFDCPGGCAAALPIFNSGEIKQKWAAAAGLRIGYLVLPQLLTYWDGGWAYSRFGAVNFASNLTGLSSGAVLPEQSYSGWFLGGGAEYALGFIPGLYWKNEYRLAYYGTKNVSMVCTSALCAGGGVVSGGPLGAVDRISPYVQTIRSELVFRFGG